MPKLVDSKKLQEIADANGMSIKETTNLYTKFSDFCRGKESLDSWDFRNSLGVLGFFSDTALSDFLFAAFDLDKDDHVSFEEYVRGLKIMTKGTPDEKLAFSFSMMDTERKGYITLEHFSLVMTSTQRLVNYIDDVTGSSGSVESDAKTITDLFNEIDQDHDGKVTLKDFQGGVLQGKNFFQWMKHVNIEGASKAEQAKKLPFIVHRDLQLIKNNISTVLETLASFNDKVEQIGVIAKNTVTPKEGESNTTNTLDSMITDINTIYSQAKAQELSVLRKIARVQKFIEVTALKRPEINLKSESTDGKRNIAKETKEDIQSTLTSTASKLTPDTSDIININDSESEEEEEEFEEEETPKDPYEALLIENDDHLQNKHNALISSSKGLAVHFAHDSWNLVLNIMMGIRMAVGRVMSEPSRPLGPDDMKMKEKMTIIPARHGEKPGEGETCRFVDYAPMVFRKLREEWNISADDYMLSVGPQQILRNIMLGNLSTLSELCSEGKSGSFFYYSSDGRYMVKTISKTEHKFFRKILSQYYNHIICNPDTLIVRFLGAHCIKFNNKEGPGKKIYFVVMGNLFDRPIKINRRFDIKGSWVGRYTPVEKRTDITRALKDLDMIELDQRIRLDSKRTSILMNQLEKDTQFLSDCGIIDYSLLLGVHYLDNPLPPRKYVEQPDVPFWKSDCGGMLSDDGKELYFMGVIDILIQFNTRKFGELTFKSMVMDNKGVSVQFPPKYRERFMSYMDQLTAPGHKPLHLGKHIQDVKEDKK
ncbi:hypothetical protein WA158_005322 [Blastocystis sp. Blastoise]